MQRTIFVCIRNTAASFALIFCVLVAASSGQANVQGRWSTLTTPMPINPVHVILLYNGKVLIVMGIPLTQVAPTDCGLPLAFLEVWWTIR